MCANVGLKWTSAGARCAAEQFAYDWPQTLVTSAYRSSMHGGSAALPTARLIAAFRSGDRRAFAAGWRRAVESKCARRGGAQPVDRGAAVGWDGLCS